MKNASLGAMEGFNVGKDASMEEDEPLLKYKRVHGFVDEVTEEDQVTAVQVHQHGVLLGTSGGSVFELGLDGTFVRRHDVHRDKVTDLSLDRSGQFFASCSDDGRVVTSPTAFAEQESPNSRLSKMAEMHNFLRPLKSIAIDPGFVESRDQMFICGGESGKLILKRKGWLSNVETVLQEGEGAITRIAWRRQFVAWANSIGVKIYDHSIGKVFGDIQRPPNVQSRCEIAWENDQTCIIAWSNFVKVVRIRDRSKSELEQNHRLSPRRADLVSHYDFSSLDVICGVLPFGEDSMALLVYPQGNEEDDVDGQEASAARRPELRIITRLNGDELSAELLPIRRFEENTDADYALTKKINDGSDEKPVLCIVSPFDVVMARPRTLDDHLNWLVSHKNFKEALRIVDNNENEKDSRRSLEDQWLTYLLKEGDAATAASLCPNLLKTDAERWTQWASKFQTFQCLDALARFLPTRDPHLQPVVYESALDELLRKGRFEGFLHRVRVWQARADRVQTGDATLNRATPLYDARRMIEKVETVRRKFKSEKISPPTAFMDALAELYCVNGQHGRAIKLYLDGTEPSNEDTITKERGEIIFGLIEEHNLMVGLEDQVRKLVALNRSVAIPLVVDLVAGDLGSEERAVSLSKIERVVDQLQNYDNEAFYEFLHSLSCRRPDEYNDSSMSKFHDLQLQLYAKYKPSAMLDFLKSSSVYTLENALEICRNHRPEPLYPEMVYILGRMGGGQNSKKALEIILDKLKDVKMAIDFIERDGSEELLSALLMRCMKDSELMLSLIDVIGEHNLNPMEIIAEMPGKMRFAKKGGRGRLVPALKKLFEDMKLQRRLRESCNEVLKTDIVNLLQDLIARRRRAVRVNRITSCEVCNRALSRPVGQFAKMTPEVVIFGSGHGYHIECIELLSSKIPDEDLNKFEEDRNLVLLGTRDIKERHARMYAKSSIITKA